MASSSNLIRAVTFDALYTIVKPRAPIPVQYAEAFAAAGLGTLDPDTIGRSFKKAYKHVNTTMPASARDNTTYWQGIIELTATGAGADVQATRAALPRLVPRLLHQFSSDEGYALYEDVKPTLRRLRGLGIRTGLITNADKRILSVLRSLGVAENLDPCLVSETEGTEKPHKEIFKAAADQMGVVVYQAVHIGDELVKYVCERLAQGRSAFDSCIYDSDYRGAREAGMQALLLRRRGELNSAAHEDRTKESLEEVTVVPSLTKAVEWIEAYNQREADSP